MNVYVLIMFGVCCTACNAISIYYLTNITEQVCYVNENGFVGSELMVLEGGNNMDLYNVIITWKGTYKCNRKPCFKALANGVNCSFTSRISFLCSQWHNPGNTINKFGQMSVLQPRFLDDGFYVQDVTIITEKGEHRFSHLQKIFITIKDIVWPDDAGQQHIIAIVFLITIVSSIMVAGLWFVICANKEVCHFNSQTQ